MCFGEQTPVYNIERLITGYTTHHKQSCLYSENKTNKRKNLEELPNLTRKRKDEVPNEGIEVNSDHKRKKRCQDRDDKSQVSREITGRKLADVTVFVVKLGRCGQTSTEGDD